MEDEGFVKLFMAESTVICTQLYTVTSHWSFLTIGVTSRENGVNV